MDSIEPEKLIQNMDSLWFFSNNLLSTNPLKSPFSLEKQINNNNNKQNSNDTISNIEQPSSKSPTCQNHQPNHPSPTNTSSFTKISPNKADNAGIHDVDNRSLRAKEEGLEGERSSRPKRRTKKSYAYLQRHNITCNVEGSGYGYDTRLFEMPSCNDDGKAMKKQLRTWAVAVAYTAVHNTNSLMVACS